MKILMLILSSPSTNEVYNLHKQVWLRYMNSNPNINCFFIEYSTSEDFSNENIIIKGNTVFIKGIESYNPGCREKTFDCFEYFMNNKKLYEYNYIIRTNMSSLWNFKTLIKHLETLPTREVYSGVIGSYSNINFVSGAGMIITPDIVELLVKNREMSNKCNILDDVDIAFIMKSLNISPIQASRTDIYSMEMFNNFKYNNDIYHYRIRWNNENLRHEEVIVMNKILDIMN